eukprot:9112055-Ditylum_brightwellii.AAC.1
MECLTGNTSGEDSDSSDMESQDLLGRGGSDKMDIAPKKKAKKEVLKKKEEMKSAKKKDFFFKIDKEKKERIKLLEDAKK